MRAVLSLAVLALFVVAVLGAGQSPWKIVNAWTKQMPGGNASQPSPVYSAVKTLYFTTSAAGTVYALNTSSRHVEYSVPVGADLTFVQNVPGQDIIIIGESDNTTAFQASTGDLLWYNSSVQIVPHFTSDDGDNNFLVFSDVLVYRSNNAKGQQNICALNLTTGENMWCDTDYNTLDMPDAAINGTFTAPIFDSKGVQYVANYDAATGVKNFIAKVDGVLTGSASYIAAINSTFLIVLDAMSGSIVSYYDLKVPFFRGTATFVHTNILAVCNGINWIAAFDVVVGARKWNVTIPVAEGVMELQHRGQEVLVLAVVTATATKFTRFDSYEGNFMWTVSARPAGISNQAVHAWLGNDILYCRDVTNTWSAYGVDSGSLISNGSGELFVPRSVAADYYEPHVGYFVTGPEGIVYALKIVPRLQASGTLRERS